MFRIGFRYFFSSLQRSRLKNVLHLSLLSISINIGVLVAGIALIRGFERTAFTKILHLSGHVRILPYDDLKELEQKEVRPNLDKYGAFTEIIETLKRIFKLETNQTPELIRVIPKLETQGMISKQQINEGVLIRCLDNDDAKFLLKNNIVRGKIDLSKRGDVLPILIGQRLAERLHVDLDEELDLSIKLSDEVETVYCKVIGIFNFDFADFDSTMVFTGKELLKPNTKPRSGNVYITRHDKVELFIQFLKAIKPGIFCESWIRQNRAFKDMFDTQVRAIYLLIGLYILSGIIQGVTSLYILLSERSNDLSILTLLGLSRYQKYKIFFGYGLLISITNTLFGLLSGIILTIVYPYLRNGYQVLTGQALIHQDVFWVSDFDPILVFEDLVHIGAFTFIAMLVLMALTSYFVSNDQVIQGIKE